MDLIQQNNNNKSYDLLPFLQDIVDKKSRFVLPFAVGVDSDGCRLMYGLEKCPHLLVAGTTGSGKSVFLNNAINSLFLSDTAFIFIDVKRVEFSQYENITRLAYPNSYTVSQARTALKTVCYNMDLRYQELKNSKCKNIQEYNQTHEKKLDYIIIVIDELADLILFDKSIEKYIVRIAQLGRAAGFHLITATQRPDSQILSGLLRANIPSRICFRVQSASNSKIILDKTGGELLQGNGDGLIFPTGFNSPIRFQAPIISTTDQELIIKKYQCNILNIKEWFI